MFPGPEHLWVLVGCQKGEVREGVTNFATPSVVIQAPPASTATSAVPGSRNPPASREKRMWISWDRVRHLFRHTTLSIVPHHNKACPIEWVLIPLVRHQLQSRLPEGLSFRFSSNQVLVEVNHQFRCALCLDGPLAGDSCGNAGDKKGPGDPYQAFSGPH